eukprot:gene245-353_t
MCDTHHASDVPPNNSRRNFLRLTTVGASALMLASALPASLVHAAPTPKAANDLNSEQALKRLMEGNQRYADGVTKRHDFMHEREALVGGQNPFVA